ncbi:hypothetical protein [Salibacterium halotolerans]|uniref:Uncharacterized protein n=1 Tax=Salibacterium halotolerans TaxID=1884432 RepID=A0A1I5PP56_9BACI|nr:hypothetical protein [Salibacterium halotolerans]SFP35824.1 hypothetical protein SAMN05518683_104184 [Salibacterium halotolerans]
MAWNTCKAEKRRCTASAFLLSTDEQERGGVVKIYSIVLSAFLAPFVFAAMGSGLHSLLQPEANSALTFGLLLVYSFPVFLVLGIPISFWIHKGTAAKTGTKVLLPTGAGAAAGSISLIFVSGQVWAGTLLGADAALVFVLLQVLIEVLSGRQRSTTEPNRR